MTFIKQPVDDFTIYTYTVNALPYHSVVWALDQTLVWIQPPHHLAVSLWLDQFREDFPNHTLSYLWVLELTPQTLLTLSACLKAMPSLLVVTSEAIQHTLTDSPLKVRFTTLEDTPFAQKQHRWVAIEANHIPTLGAHVLYVPQAKLLVCATLLSQASPTFDKDALKAYHEQHLSHSDILKPLLKPLKALEVDLCVTTMGPLYEEGPYRLAVVTLMQHTFYPKHFIVEAAHAHHRQYDYEALCQQTMLNLLPRFGETRLIETFSTHNLILERETLELKNPALKGHKLWHHLYHIIHTALGEEALHMLEPFVKKMHDVYHVPIPNVYRSLKHQFDLTLAKIDAQNQDLMQSLSNLQTQLDQTQNKLLRDPLTNRFNSIFFERFLEDRKDDDWHVCVVSIDRFNVLNQRLGVHGANEVLKTLSYLIEETLPEDCVIFKYTGTQFALWLAANHDLKVWTEKLRNAVRESTLFVEAIDVNLAGVSTVPLREDPREAYTLSSLYKQLNARVLKSQNDGPGAIVIEGDAQVIQTHKTVLIVDEDDVNLRLITRFLERTEFRVVSCSSVEEALERLNRLAVDVIISELNLAKLDGFALKQKLNAEAAYASIPFIIASHNKNERTLTRAYELNVDAVLQKPLYLEEVHGLIKRFTRGRQR